VHAVAGAVEQRRTQPALGLAQPVGQRRLRDAEVLGGVRDVAVVGDRADHRQVTDFEASGGHDNEENSLKQR